MQGQVKSPIEGARVVEQTGVGVRVKAVLPGGIAEAVGVQPGDVVEAINDQPIRDPIDYRFHLGEEEVEVRLNRGSEVVVLEIGKDADDDLGLLLDDMPILKCDNACVFCFLHQMPKGMRKTLYYQDDDYRLSFLHGAYVTLTNLSEAEFQRIAGQKLSPMYVSVHATDPDLRGTVLGRRNSVDVMERVRFLAENGIRMHTQVVLCPGLNDGPHLKRTVFDLASCHPDVESLGIVPVGLTRHRKNLPDLDPVTPQIAADCIEQVSEWQARFQARLGANFVYLGDEFYLLAERDIPSEGYYGGFPLVENGVGMVRRFRDAFEEGFSRLEGLSPPPVRATLVTGVLGGRFLREMVRRLNRLPWLEVLLVEVENRFFGPGITVSGLLTGADILGALQEDLRPADVVVLPPNCISHSGILLDDLSPADLAQSLGCEVVVGDYDLSETIAELANGRRKGLPDANDAFTGHPYISTHQVGR